MNSPKLLSCLGRISCSSANNLAISCESLVILQSSSAWKSGFICLHRSIWLITFPNDGPARFSEETEMRYNSIWFYLIYEKSFIIEAILFLPKYEDISIGMTCSKW